MGHPEITAQLQKNQKPRRGSWSYHREDILFSQLLVALSLTQAQRHMVIAHFESTSSTKTVEHLQNITIRLFAAYGAMRNGTFALVEDKEGNGTRDGPGDEIWLMEGQKGKRRDPDLGSSPLEEAIPP